MDFDKIVKTYHSNYTPNTRLFWRHPGYYAPIQHGAFVDYYFVMQYQFWLEDDNAVNELARKEGLGTPMLVTNPSEF